MNPSRMKTSLLAILCLFSSLALANSKVAKVLVLRGSARVKITETGKTSELKKGDWVAEGSVIQTSKKSFVRLLFSDKSSMNLGPESQMVINEFKKGKAGLITLVKGKLRSQVTKDPLQKSTGKNKLYIKTKSAAMGVRGTYFLTTFNEQNGITNIVTFEGNVAMGNIAPGRDIQSFAELVQTVDSGYEVKEGQFSNASPSQTRNTVPTKINTAQLGSLRNNQTFKVATTSSAAPASKPATLTPPGVNVTKFSGAGEGIIQAATAVIGSEGVAAVEQAVQQEQGDAPPPEGFFNPDTGEVAPPAGAFVDLNSGVVIPPPPGSAFDPNTGTFNPPAAYGQIDPASGEYLPPSGLAIDPATGQFVQDPTAQAQTDANGNTSPPPPPPPILGAESFGGEGFAIAPPDNPGPGQGNNGGGPPPPPPGGSGDDPFDPDTDPFDSDNATNGSGSDTDGSSQQGTGSITITINPT